MQHATSTLPWCIIVVCCHGVLPWCVARCFPLSLPSLQASAPPARSGGVQLPPPPHHPTPSGADVSLTPHTSHPHTSHPHKPHTLHSLITPSHCLLIHSHSSVPLSHLTLHTSHPHKHHTPHSHLTLTAHPSPLTTHPSPLTPHRSPLTSHRSSLTSHPCTATQLCG